MNVAILDTSDDIEMLRSIGEEWKESANDIEYYLPIDVNIGLATLRKLQMQNNGDVLVLLSNNIVQGFIGLVYALNHVGPGLILNECLFYVTPSARTRGSVMLKNEAEKLGKAKGCNWSIMNASKLAGDSDKSSKFFCHCGYIPFEISHLKVL